MSTILVSQKVVERCKLDEMVTKIYAKIPNHLMIEFKTFSNTIDIPILKHVKPSWISNKPPEINTESFIFTGTIEYIEELDNFDNEILTKVYYYTKKDK